MSKSKIEICLYWEVDEGLYFADMCVNEDWDLDNDGMDDVDQWDAGIGISHPLLDDDGDRDYSSSDGSLAAATYI